MAALAGERANGMEVLLCAEFRCCRESQIQIQMIGQKKRFTTWSDSERALVEVENDLSGARSATRENILVGAEIKIRFKIDIIRSRLEHSIAAQWIRLRSLALHSSLDGSISISEFFLIIAIQFTVQHQSDAQQSNSQRLESEIKNTNLVSDQAATTSLQTTTRVTFSSSRLLAVKTKLS